MGKLHEVGHHKLSDRPQMLLHIVTLTLEPVDPLLFSLPELRTHFAARLGEYMDLHRSDIVGFIHRYPVVQCKMIKNTLMVLGISQGAALLDQLANGQTGITAGINTCTIRTRDTSIRQEVFGISGTVHTYEFLTPWLALNQQNTKKFYELKGKTERDLFIKKILEGNLAILAKSLDYKTPVPITCNSKIKFRIDWIDRGSVIAFLGKFQANVTIPDYFGIGQSVSQGYGTMKRIPDTSIQGEEVNS
ncbi:MAG: CRISPR-associated endonuclease Cas6 [Methanomicrobiales archaeon]